MHIGRTNGTRQAGWLRRGYLSGDARTRTRPGINGCSLRDPCEARRVINRNPKSWLFAIVGAEQVLKLLPRGTHDHKKFIKPSELAAYCRQAGLEFKELRGMTYSPLSKRFSLTRDVDVNYLVHCERPAALPS